jgi:hypothetical protein
MEQMDMNTDHKNKLAYNAGKLYLLALTIWLVLMFGGMALSDWHNHNCRVELAVAGRTVQDIDKICRR